MHELQWLRILLGMIADGTLVNRTARGDKSVTLETGRQRLYWRLKLLREWVDGSFVRRLTFNEGLTYFVYYRPSLVDEALTGNQLFDDLDAFRRGIERQNTRLSTSVQLFVMTVMKYRYHQLVPCQY